MKTIHYVIGILLGIFSTVASAQQSISTHEVEEKIASKVPPFSEVRITKKAIVDEFVAIGDIYQISNPGTGFETRNLVTKNAENTNHQYESNPNLRFMTCLDLWKSDDWKKSLTSSCFAQIGSGMPSYSYYGYGNYSNPNYSLDYIFETTSSRKNSVEKVINDPLTTNEVHCLTNEVKILKEALQNKTISNSIKALDVDVLELQIVPTDFDRKGQITETTYKTKIIGVILPTKAVVLPISLEKDGKCLVHNQAEISELISGKQTRSKNLSEGKDALLELDNVLDGGEKVTPSK